MISIKNILKEAYDFKEKQNQYFTDAKNKYLDDIEKTLKSMGVDKLSRIVDKYDRPNTLQGNGWTGEYHQRKIKIEFSISGYSLMVSDLRADNQSPKFTALNSMTAWMEKNIQ